MKIQKKRGITLVALVITIIILLLLAGVAIQIAIGENGLIPKSIKAQKEQAKAELHETVKLNYLSLNSKALENGQNSPAYELAFSGTDNIVDKKGTIIDTKENTINAIKEVYQVQSSSQTVQGRK